MRRIGDQPAVLLSHTAMGILWAYLGAIVAVAVGLAYAAWRFTGKIVGFWPRILTRSLVMACLFSPTIVPVPGLHGALPMPATWVLLSGLFGFGGSDRLMEVRHGGIPLVVGFGVFLLTGLAWRTFRSPG